jgi:acyl-CoA thioester hydrolase
MNTELLAQSACHTTRVTFSEVDALGYVHHSCAAVWFERAREAYFRKFGLPPAELAKHKSLLAMKTLNVEYDSFIGYDHLLEVRVVLTQLLRVSAQMHYRIDNRSTGALAVRGFTQLVAVQLKEDDAPPGLSRIHFREAFLPRVVRSEDFFSMALPPSEF